MNFCAIRCQDSVSAGAPARFAGPAGVSLDTLSVGKVRITVEGNALQRFTYTDADISIVCRADLLESAAEPRNSGSEPAAYIGGLYRQRGPDFVRLLRGTFAVVLYDHRSDTLHAYTDHFGAQRLVYRDSSTGFGIATDLRLLMKVLGGEAEVDPTAIQEYVQYSCIPSPRTIYKGFFKLPPAHSLTWKAGVSLRRYWDVSYHPEDNKSEDFWAEQTLKSVRDAVSRHVTGLDNPNSAGCFLSGGTDSSSVAALVGQTTGRPPRTFSIGFDHPRYNEMSYARLAAERSRADHHEYFVKPGDILDLLHKATGFYDEPFGNSSIVPTYFCARLAAENGITHMLAGDGGDELFGGNSRYVEDRVFQRYRAIPSPLRTGMIEPFVALAARSGRGVAQKAAKYINRSNIPMPDRVFSYSFLSSIQPAELFNDGFLETLKQTSPLETARRHFAAAQAADDLNRWLYLDLQITISDNDLRKVTVMSQAAGIKARYPLLDPLLAEFTGRIPPALKVKRSELRYIFKKAMAPILPPQIIAKSKHGFGLPYSVWVGESRPLHDFTFDVLGSNRCRERGYFRRDLLEWLWKQYETVSRIYFGDVLWVFLMLELWHQQTSATADQVVPTGGVTQNA